MDRFNNIYSLCGGEFLSMGGVFDYQQHRNEILQCKRSDGGMDVDYLHGPLRPSSNSSFLRIGQKGEYKYLDTTI